MCLLLPPVHGQNSSDAIDASAAWELRLLGVDTPAKLSALCEFPKQRTVKLGIVGQGGVSRQHLQPLLAGANTLTYHDCSDPGKNTHDTQMANVILRLTNALGVSVAIHAWQPGQSFSDVAERMRAAAKTADVVSFYQSFWGPNAQAITQAIAESGDALFISPYVEHGGRPTSTTPQGGAAKPWLPESSTHFVTVVPLARKSDASILTPTDRGADDSEAVNLIAPSFHASGPGGTCPAGAVATACAMYLYAVSPAVPTPLAVIDTMRSTSALDREVLTAADEYAAAAIDRLEQKISSLIAPPEGKQRKLDASGVLHLFRAFEAVTELAAGPAQ